MYASHLVKKLSRYVLSILIPVIVIGTCLASDFYRMTLDSQAGFNMEVWSGSGNSQTLIFPDSQRECFSQLIYTSLPPKCRKLDGTFVELDDVSSDFIVIPPRK